MKRFVRTEYNSVIQLKYRTVKKGNVEMKLQSNWHTAITQRTSRRSYQKQSIEPQKTVQIKALIDEINEKSGLHIQFIENGNRFLNGFKASYGLITGMPSLIALVGNTRDPELKRSVGYYGEFLVLECVSLGLGTCWISGTYDRKECLQSLNMKAEEDLVCVIAVGNTAQGKGIKEQLVSRLNGRKQTFDELLKEQDGNLPPWVVSGIEAARLAPSAVNGKPIGYRFKDNRLTVFITKKNHGAETIDLGISMANFQLGAMHEQKEGTWRKAADGYSFE